RTPSTRSGNLYCQWELSPGSGISILLAVGTPSTGSGNLYCQWEHSPGSGNALCILFPTIDCQIVDNCKKSLGYESYNAVSPHYIVNFMPPKPDLSYTSLDEYANKIEVENKSCGEETKSVRNDDNEEKNVNQPKIVKKVRP
nr:hypothetical protein [Tanacetum cinerariifolium]